MVLAFGVLFCCFLSVEENIVFILTLIAVWSLSVTEVSYLLLSLLLPATISSHAVGIPTNLSPLPALLLSLKSSPLLLQCFIAAGDREWVQVLHIITVNTDTRVLLAFLGSSHEGTSASHNPFA